MSTNPLTQVTDALWTLLEANSGFTALVPEQNRIKYDKRNPEKSAAQKADYPLVRIREFAGRASLHNTTNSSAFIKQYQIQIATGEQSYVLLHDVEWEIIRAFADWPTTLLALTWDVDGSHPVQSCRLLSAEQTLDNRNVNRGIRGWSTVWECMVDFWFKSDTLKP